MPQKTFVPTIGIECHVQLKTKTKLFSAVDNDASTAPPNSLISHIDAGLPGALPVLNKKALELACRAAFVLGTEPQKFSRFDRKHYFYPDLPKGYQITQYEKPIISGGWVQINPDEGPKKIGITRVNLEEDAGKTIHPAGAKYSLVDLNRAGTPLLEIVSEPEIHSPSEAKAYVRELYLLMKYADISDCDLYLGQMRFDVNTSLSNNGKLGTRSEVKNLNSFRSVEAAVSYEIKRQTELLEKGQEVMQETRGWDEAKQKTTSQREKEEAHDYRYMPEPDIPPLELTTEFISDIRQKMPKSLQDIRTELMSLDLEPRVREDILVNQDICMRVLLALESDASKGTVRRIAFDLLEEPSSLSLPLSDHIKIAELLVAKKINSSSEKELIIERARNPKADLDELISNKSQVSDEAELEEIVAEVISQNPKVVEDIKNGQEKAISFLVGQVMQRTRGRANPTVAKKLIEAKLK